MFFGGKLNNKKPKPAVQPVTELTVDISLDMSSYLVSPYLCKSTECLASLFRSYFSEYLDCHITVFGSLKLEKKKKKRYHGNLPLPLTK